MWKWQSIALGTLILIKLDAPDRQTIYINPQQIVSVRAPRSHIDAFGPNVHCLIHTADGKYIAVIQPCDKFVTVVEPDK